MNYIRVKCVNKDCEQSKFVGITIPAGRPVAPGITEKLGTLTCDACGHDAWSEPVK